MSDHSKESRLRLHHTAVQGPSKSVHFANMHRHLAFLSHLYFIISKGDTTQDMPHMLVGNSPMPFDLKDTLRHLRVDSTRQRRF